MYNDMPVRDPAKGLFSQDIPFLWDTKNPEEKSSGSVRCLLWVSSASAKTHQKKQSSSSIQTVLSASEFPSAPIAEGSPNHAPADLYSERLVGYTTGWDLHPTLKNFTFINVLSI